MPSQLVLFVQHSDDADDDDVDDDVDDGDVDDGDADDVDDVDDDGDDGVVDVVDDQRIHRCRRSEHALDPNFEKPSRQGRKYVIVTSRHKRGERPHTISQEKSDALSRSRIFVPSTLTVLKMICVAPSIGHLGFVERLEVCIQ